MKLAERSGSAAGDPVGNWEACLRVRGKDAHRRRGNQATASRDVGVGETGGNKTPGARVGTPVDNGRGACGLERGARFLRGKTSEGRKPRNGFGTKQGRELEQARKPLRG
jgi:hypothetical protein